jgi:hypothetical protein
MFSAWKAGVNGSKMALVLIGTPAWTCRQVQRFAGDDSPLCLGMAAVALAHPREFGYAHRFDIVSGRVLRIEQNLMRLTETIP